MQYQFFVGFCLRFKFSLKTYALFRLRFYKSIFAVNKQPRIDKKIVPKICAWTSNDEVIF